LVDEFLTTVSIRPNSKILKWLKEKQNWHFMEIFMFQRWNSVGGYH
jgi:hypothetical protein